MRKMRISCDMIGLNIKMMAKTSLLAQEAFFVYAELEIYRRNFPSDAKLLYNQEIVFQLSNY